MTTTVNDHVAKSDDKQITRFGCESFCTSLTQSEFRPTKIRVEFEDEIVGVLSKDQCSAEQIKDNAGFYKGCKTNVNGHIRTSDQKDLTSLGCDTFCAGLARFQRQILKMEQENRTPIVPEEKRAVKQLLNFKIDIFDSGNFESLETISKEASLFKCYLLG